MFSLDLYTSMKNSADLSVLCAPYSVFTKLSEQLFRSLLEKILLLQETVSGTIFRELSKIAVVGSFV